MLRILPLALVVLLVAASPASAPPGHPARGAGRELLVENTDRGTVFRIATGTAQGLKAGGVGRSFLELGEHGDRLVLRADPS